MKVQFNKEKFASRITSDAPLTESQRAFCVQKIREADGRDVEVSASVPAKTGEGYIAFVNAPLVIEIPD